MRVLGVDVGVKVCGICLCDLEGSETRLVRELEIKPSSFLPLPQKLKYIFAELSKEVESYRPGAIVVEKLYSHYRHPQTIGLLAQVRGVVALLASQANVEFYEYLPTRARKSFLGRGNVKSAQVQKMAENITGRKFSSMHTADAFSLVVTFSHKRRLARAMNSSC